MANSENPPICQKCRYYKVTWDPRQPHACLLFNFKSPLLPCIEVQNSTGMPCPRFRISLHHSQKTFPLAEEDESITEASFMPPPLGAILGKDGILR